MPMEQSNDVREYVASFFSEHKPQVNKGMLVRITNGLIRSRVETMDALCAMPPEQIQNLRNLGEKSIAVIFKMREQYITDNARPPASI